VSLSDRNLHDRRVFGVDGGGTSTRLRISDLSCRALWEGSAGGVNPNSVRQEVWADRLVALFREGLAAVGMDPREVAAVCLGVAGTDRPSEKEDLERVLRDQLGLRCPLLITTDADVALVGALQDPEGMILVCGTGSIAIARLADGTRVRAGGYGHFLGDEGSAFSVGFQAIRRSLRSMEGRDERTGMLPVLMERFGLADPGLFVPLVYQRFDKAAIAACAALVETFRAAGDPLAVSIFEDAARELALLVRSVYERVRQRISNRSLVMQGGLLENSSWLRQAVVSHLRGRHPEIVVSTPVESPSYGACLLASRLAD
jgi:N-acetylglucosamine kinase-like BadF-type ATPase